MMAEFLASTIFSLLYFIFISRYLSEEFNMRFVVLSFAIGLSFFAAVYIPFHTYRIHIIPFVSIINSLRKRQWRILWHKIPAQFTGAFLGVLIFNYINQVTVQVNIEEIQNFKPEDPFLLAFLNGLLAAVLCYLFYIVRVLFKQRRLTGTILLGLCISVLFYLSGSIAGLSALNPFGLFMYDMMGPQAILKQNWFFTILTHVLVPVIATGVTFLKLKDILTKPESKYDKVAEDESLMKHYDI